jgi:protein-tyrosine phosphatase
MSDRHPSPSPHDQHALPLGCIDIHSHMIPGVDDGCQSLEETLQCIAILREHGFVASICTPHLWPTMFPANTPANIVQWTESLRQRLAERGVDYRVYPGGELRLFDGVTSWMEKVGVPTLASSRYVLCDFWEPRWRRWVDEAFDWLLRNRYTPILAHPERLSIPKILPDKLAELTARGVLLQGNFRCFTGEEGGLADQQVRAWMDESRYTFLAMDMHRPDAMPGRIDGLHLVERDYGRELLDQMTITHPRQMVLGLDG